MASTRGIVNRVLSNYCNYIADVGEKTVLPGMPQKGWKKYSKLFCDNIILWALYTRSGDVEKQKKSTITAILAALEDLDVNRSMVKVLRQGAVTLDETFFTKDHLDKYSKNVSKGGDLGYFSIKVTLHEFKLVSVLDILDTAMDDLADDYIYLHDVDIATDCRHVTSRKILRDYLEDKLGDTIEFVEDLTKVGNHCLSWCAITEKKQRVRCKVYNKFVQMMESAETTSSLGSRMESIVMPVDEKFHKRLRRARKTGLTRLEVTFYGSKLRRLSYYETYLELVKEQIQECQTYAVPYEEYWKYMASTISSMVGVFAVGAKETAFAYCHWWNSITKKKYGSFRANVDQDEAMKLLANYSFNDRPIYFLEVSLDEPSKEVVVTKYLRSEDCNAITLVAGKQNGLYPYRYHDDVYDFADMGIVETNNITIQWPERRHRKTSPPIANIYKVEMDEKDMQMQTEGGVGNKTLYKLGHEVLKENTKYTVIAAIKNKFRGKDYFFATLSNGIKVKCGNSLEAKITEWLDDHPDGEAPYMKFTTMEKKRIRGYTDILVR